MASIPIERIEQRIREAIKTNNNQEITGSVLQNVLIGITEVVDSSFISNEKADSSFYDKQYIDSSLIKKVESTMIGNPPSGVNVVAAFKGNTLIGASTAVGNSNTPIYIDGDGVATECNIGSVYAQKDGYYSQLGAGTADNLAGRADDAVPAEIVFRPSGGTADIADGTATVTEFNGKTVVWNQLIIEKNATNTEGGVTYTYNQDGSVILNGICTEAATSIIYRYNVNALKDHYYYVGCSELTSLKATNTTNLSVSSGRRIIKCSSTGDPFFKLSGIVGNTYTNYRCYPQCIDLTKMFGGGNEPATVEEFESMFPLPYYDYNEGELVSFNGTAIKSVGFNAYNPATGKAEVVGGNVYQITGTYTSITLDGVAITPDADGHFTPSKNGELVVVGGNNTDTCIHLSHSGYRDGEYEPYWTAERELPVSKINTDGTITDSSTGKTRLFPNGLLSAGNVKDSITRYGAVKRLGIVNLGNLKWMRASDKGGYFYSTINNINSRTNNLINKLYTVIPTTQYSTADKHIDTADYHVTNEVNVFDSSYTDAASFKTAMSGVYLYYELATPIEVTFAEPLNLSYKVSDFGTEQLLPVNGSEPVTTPFNGEIAYGINAVDTLRNLPKNYISKESFTNFTSALGTSLGKTIAMTWNSTTGEYDFTITDNTNETSE